MGVHGLWELLAPVGRRVSVETLSGKKLAIDASIWMVQFMKAMRDDNGEMVKNAHLLGFFRRICKLLYLRTKPLFVFDGGTPALKRRTVFARRRQRENAQAKIRKTAEKLLLNHLKTMRLKELATNLENQRENQKQDVKGKKVLLDERDIWGKNLNLEGNNELSGVYSREKLDEMLAASIPSEDGQSLAKNPSTSSTTIESFDKEEDTIMLQATKQRKAVNHIKNKTNKAVNDAEHMSVLSTQNNIEGLNLENDNMMSRGYSQEYLDEMLAASIAAEEEGSLGDNPSSFGAISIHEDSDSCEDEEMILPVMHGKVDPAVLAALPPSMQLDLLVRMREGLMAENRQRYQKVKKAPEKFSVLQIQSYLKTVAFRREIDEVQRAANGMGVGGVQTSRIASEPNREFIFSSSFTGSKKLLASSGIEKNVDKSQHAQEELVSPNPMTCTASVSKSNSEALSVLDENLRGSDDNIVTYLDEMGRMRVSRVRAMGIRMTRDLQRNLDLMKEVELEQTTVNGSASDASARERNDTDVAECSSRRGKFIESSHVGDVDPVDLITKNEPSLLKNGGCIEISFEDNPENRCLDTDDNIFASLVKGIQTTPSLDDNPISKPSIESTSMEDWEEGYVEGRGDDSFNEGEGTIRYSPGVGNISDDSEVEWEDGSWDISKSSLTTNVTEKPVTKGFVEEEAELHEALRRSLEDLECEKDNDVVSENRSLKHPREDAGVLKPETLDKVYSSQNFVSPDRQNPDSMADLMNKHGRSSNLNLQRLMLSSESVINLEPKETNLMVENSLETCAQDGELLSSIKMSSSDKMFVHMVGDKEKETSETYTLGDARIGHYEGEPSCHYFNVHKQSESIMGSQAIQSDKVVIAEQNSPDEKDCDHDMYLKDKFAFMENENFQVNDPEGILEEEMLRLSSERVCLGNEQRQLERNAESVSSEMFAECQELLQMFGLPYIIAPMEAEAQCAYLELVNLVDGVVTDDSDAFLFGAQSVYKNIFDDRKYVETYFMKDIEKELGLTREKLIRMAMLLGSDYTEGVSGIGIVNAIEVINAFPEEDGLRNFREWIETPDPAILGKIGKFDAQSGSSASKKGSKVGDDMFKSSNGSAEALGSVEDKASQNEEKKQGSDKIRESRQIFVDKHRNVSKNWHLPSSFPSDAIIHAYNSPQVDSSTEAFSWGKPDVLVLRKLCWEKFGWASQKSDELLLPVLKEYNKHETQLRMEAFYSFNERFAKIRSKRIQKALKGITKNRSTEITEDVQEASKIKRKRKGVRHGDATDDKSDKSSICAEELVTRNEISTLEKSSTKHSRKSRNMEQTLLAEDGNVREKGFRGGRGRGRGRGRKVKGGRVCDPGLFESSSGDEQVVHGGNSEGPLSVRRSARLQKSVNDVDNDNSVKSFQHGDKGISDLFELENPSISRVLWGQPVEGVNIEEEPGTIRASSQGSFDIESKMSGSSGNRLNTLFEAEFSEDLLKTGGGFCVEEEEAADKNENDVLNRTIVSVSETANSLPCAGSIEDANTSARLEDGRKMDGFGITWNDSSTNEDGASSALGLSAMPCLKRKRRRG